MLPTLLEEIRTPHQDLWAVSNLVTTAVVTDPKHQNFMYHRDLIGVALINQRWLVAEAKTFKKKPYATKGRCQKLDILINSFEEAARKMEGVRERSVEEMIKAGWSTEWVRKFVHQGYLWRVALQGYEKQEVAKQLWARMLEDCFEVWNQDAAGNGRAEATESNERKEGVGH